MKKIIIIFILVALVGGVGYNFFNKKDEKSNGLSSSRDAKNQNQVIGANLLISLTTLDSLELDISFFKDQSFRKLVDFSKEIPFQKPGRSNPFSFIGDVSAISATSSNTR